MAARPTLLASRPNLKGVWNSSKDSRLRGRSAGVDGISPEAFRRRLDDNLAQLREKMLSGNFSYQDLRPVFIPREGKSDRVICVPTVEDRLVQRVALAYLTSGDKLSVRNSVSFGFHSGPNSGVREAVRTARRLREQHRYVFKSDIQSFFDGIHRPTLKTDLIRVLRQRSVVPFLLAAIDTEIRPGDRSDVDRIAKTTIKHGQGLRQGMPLSPLLSNFVLRDFDRGISGARFRMVRYADDFAIFCDSAEECQRALALVVDLLRQKNHEVPPLGHNSKTKIHAPNEQVEFLGFAIVPEKRTYKIVVPESAFARVRDLAALFNSYITCRTEYKTLARALQALDSKLSSFASSYRVATNHGALLNHIAQCRGATTRRLLADIFGEEAIKHVTQEKESFLGIA
jgi:RNA-directed DNA polymerase